MGLERKVSPRVAPLGLYISGIGIVLQRPLTRVNHLRLDIRGFEGLTAEEVADALLRVVAVDEIRCLTRTTKSCHTTVASSLVKHGLLSTGVRDCHVDLAPVGVPTTLVSIKFPFEISDERVFFGKVDSVAIDFQLCMHAYKKRTWIITIWPY